MRDHPSTRREFLRAAVAAASASTFLASSASGDAEVDGWDIGPFVKHEEPVLRPAQDSRFRCPIRGKEVRWEEQNVYNPAAVVRDGKVHLLYRADDRSPDLGWGRTCRIGLAWSEDGVTFTRHGEPVLYPDDDPWRQYEWEGGCEDLHVIEGEDGTYYMNYTTRSGTRDTMSVAASRDLYRWTKHGPAFRKAAPEKVQGGHATLGAWTLRQALIDPKDMTAVLEYRKEPFLHPEYDWEKRGMTADTTVSNGLVPFKDKWFLYYGAADHVIGLATCTRG